MTIKTHHTLLMTGAAGGLGQAMRSRLQANCDLLRLSDIGAMAPAQAGEEVVTADLADAAAVNQLVAGCQAIVHFGGVSTEQPWAPILQANIIGAYNLYEAAVCRVSGKAVAHQGVEPSVHLAEIFVADAGRFGGAGTAGVAPVGCWHHFACGGVVLVNRGKPRCGA